MEWIKINHNKLKIMLTREDAARYALSTDTADYTNTETKRAFKAILTDMREKTGFDAAEDKVYIQMYPSREGGCELFITKMGMETAPKKAACDKEKVSPARQRRSLVFCFENMTRLIAVCRRLSEVHYKGESCAWLDDCHRYWLYLTEDGNPLTARRDYAFVSEYGDMESRENADLMLPEHGKTLCACHAVETLGTL